MIASIAMSEIDQFVRRECGLVVEETADSALLGQAIEAFDEFAGVIGCDGPNDCRCSACEGCAECIHNQCAPALSPTVTLRQMRIRGIIANNRMPTTWKQSLNASR